MVKGLPLALRVPCGLHPSPESLRDPAHPLRGDLLPLLAMAVRQRPGGGHFSSTSASAAAEPGGRRRYRAGFAHGSSIDERPLPQNLGRDHY